MHYELQRDLIQIRFDAIKRRLSPMTSLQDQGEGGWRPIETAPKDNLILATNVKSKWVEIVVFIPRKPGDGREGPGWYAYHGDVTPTHWMPFPSPPVATG